MVSPVSVVKLLSVPELVRVKVTWTGQSEVQTRPLRSSFLCYMVKIIFHNSFMKFALNVHVPGLAVCSRLQLVQMMDGKRECMLNCHQPRFVYSSTQSGPKSEEKGEKGTRSLQQGI